MNKIHFVFKKKDETFGHSPLFDYENEEYSREKRNPDNSVIQNIVPRMDIEVSSRHRRQIRGDQDITTEHDDVTSDAFLVEEPEGWGLAHVLGNYTKRFILNFH